MTTESSQTASPKVIRLRLELLYPCDLNPQLEEELWEFRKQLKTYRVVRRSIYRSTFQRFASLRGQTLSRELLIPADMPLWALNYAIQKAFGFTDTKEHYFYFSDKVFNKLCRQRSVMWFPLLGVLFRSPIRNPRVYEYDYDPETEKTPLRVRCGASHIRKDRIFFPAVLRPEFYETIQKRSDYVRSIEALFPESERKPRKGKDGSLLPLDDWLREQCTGPYEHTCRSEMYRECQYDGRVIRYECHFIQTEVQMNSDGLLYERKNRISTTPHYNGEFASERDRRINIRRRQIVRINQLPSRGLQDIFTRPVGAILERLRLADILCIHGDSLKEPLAPSEEKHESYDRFHTKACAEDCKRLLAMPIKDSFHCEQPRVVKVTDKLFYCYDTNDAQWRFSIEGSYGCKDLLESGVIAEDALADAIRRVEETHCPVCLAADGLPLLEPAGDMEMYVGFLQSFHEQPSLKQFDYDRWSNEKRLAWAKSWGWTDKMPTPDEIL